MCSVRASSYSRATCAALLSILIATALALAGCSTGSDPGSNPLVRTYTTTAPAGSSVVVEFGPGSGYGFRTASYPAPAGGGNLSIIVAGLKPETLYHMRARITHSDGSVTFDSDRIFLTGSIDLSRFPKITVSGNTGTGRGIELVNVISQPGHFPGNEVQAFATDLDGNIIWYYDHPSDEGFVFPPKPLPNGNMLLIISDYATTGIMREVNLAGETIREIRKDDLNNALAAAGFNLVVKHLHHDVLKLPSGHYILLAAEDRNVSALVGIPDGATIEGDALIDLDPNLKPVWVWSAFDQMDVNRHPLAPFPPDWTHGNALIYTQDHNLLLSLRNQHWIVKIDYRDGAGNGKLLWRLGHEGDFVLQNRGPEDWFYGQHFPAIISTNGSRTRLSVFDNGNDRVTPAGKCGSEAIPCYSRAVIYEIDEAAKTATMLWEYKPGLYSFWGGSTSPMPSGDLEFALSAPAGLPGSRALEVTTNTQSDIIWEMNLSVPRGYRILRIPSLYPGVTW